MKPKKIDEIETLEAAILSGVRLGMARAYKHDDFPSEDMHEKELVKAIMMRLCEEFDFDD